ncbi:MAG: tRNA preQ1(34) S-adenosylmethionine ribosyltransferase-isomerase QueA [Deltaproteobacteria bacterium]|nr:tRNA preQ1(34) S-adenosylmethionine ribosyltransferase-isomerase QueA [Deltaproteobacteria bacterium]
MTMTADPSSFDYTLPPERIAQWPAGASGSRSDSKLLVASSSGSALTLSDSHVRDIRQFLRPGDLLVFNDSGVIPARFFVDAEGRTVEIFLLALPADETETEVEVLARPMDKLREGKTVVLSDGLFADVLGRTTDRSRLRLRLRSSSQATVRELVASAGIMPIPPYIRGGRGELRDRELYQCVFSQEPGSVAAPTAGLHFTPELLAELEQSGVSLGMVTLHVGSASFRPAQMQDPKLERGETEWYRVSIELAEKIAQTKSAGGRVVAIGTTTVRALESAALSSMSGGLAATDLMIKPGHVFQTVDVMFTNFHQPGSTHLLLVSAFFGASNMARVYQHALDNAYRFLSYGDAQLLVREE